MAEDSKIIEVAVVQAAPVLFNLDATIEKTCDFIRTASQQGARLILFPEAFVPAYPRGLTFGTVVGSRHPAGRKVWQAYWENSVEVPGPATTALGEAAREANVYLAIGVIERDTLRGKGTLYCTLLYFGQGASEPARQRRRSRGPEPHQPDAGADDALAAGRTPDAGALRYHRHPPKRG